MCGFVGRDIKHVRSHIWAVHKSADVQLKCSRCDFTTVWAASIKRHEARHDGVRAFQCTVCPKAFTDSSLLSAHKRVHKPDRPRPFVCPTCHSRYEKRTALRFHIKQAHQRLMLHACNLCPYKFFSESSLGLHVETVHNGKRPFVCASCNKGFTRRNGLNRHIQQVHEKIRTISCPKCPYVMADQTQLRRHLQRVHSDVARCGDKPVKCPHCDGHFATRVALGIHIPHSHPTEYKASLSGKAPKRPRRRPASPSSAPGPSAPCTL